MSPGLSRRRRAWRSSWVPYLRRAAIVVGVAVTIVFLTWSAPHLILDRDLRDEAEQLSPDETAAALNAVRTTLVQAVGGLVVVIGVAAAWRQSRFGETAHLVQAFTQTVERLDSKEVDIRTGALFALGLTARPLSKVQIVADTICRWARHYPTPEPLGGDPHAVPARLRSRAPDLQAALDIVTQMRLPSTHYLRLFNADLRGATLRGSRLYKADLRNARLDASDLRGADLRRAHLDGTSLAGVDLVDADLRRVKYSIDTVWTGAKIRAGWRKLPRDLDPNEVGIVQQAKHEVPRGFDEPRGPGDAARGKFGG